MWETAGKAGLITANLMWSAFVALPFFLLIPRVLLGRDLLKLFPVLRLHIMSLTRYVRSFLPPDIFNDFVQEKSLDLKLSKILEWIDLPLSERPQLILGTPSETWALTIFLSLIF
jgi:hypothetical protein